MQLYQEYQGQLIGIALVVSLVAAVRILGKRHIVWQSTYPPIVKLSDEQIFHDPINAYESAIRAHGDVIAVKKKGRMEIVVSEKFVSKVLMDDANFSFEQGVAKAMNMEFMITATNGKYFKDMAVTVDNLLAKRMNTVVKQLAPTFFSHATELAKAPEDASHDLSLYAQRTVSEAMVILLLGQHFLNERNARALMWAANDVAELGGIFQNRSWFARTWPALWRPITWFKVVVLRVLIGMGATMGRSIAIEMSRLLRDPDTFSQNEDTTLLALLVRRYATTDGTLSLKSKCNIYMILISAVFASVHQVASTMVWVMCELALRPDYQEDIRSEIMQLIGNGTEPLDNDLLNKAVLTDSFIREVMRTKGDTFSTVRMTTKDVPLGGYILPKGYTVHPIASLAHRAPAQVGENPEEFDAFGMGRWACPGRFLAVAGMNPLPLFYDLQLLIVWPMANPEIKLMLFSILSQMKVQLVDGKYEIVDKLMIASAPPAALFLLGRHGQ
ncbi:hypothetical protein CNMCM5793_003602 [Aspergillus hiratsukae]|uniref:Cytochrome P450 n=1 Tax=Aspergillus hiratsukae TaxID=1194566 RepID=A0A8H6QF34_9EURO|nr:hypothetical protein CNMCM5793_003602 [Aspergillus hiratsukae]KAF7171818.1 hypothetical protein CNMCM6106_006167 [Aspergillus hiratsukae]